MASGYKHLRCPGCDGTLEYKKEKKIWECRYCGNEIRREEEYDGLYTIKNIVKQVLLDLAYSRMDSAMKNLLECRKISSDYIGTVIAELSLKVITLTIPNACEGSQIKAIYDQIKRLRTKLQEMCGDSIPTEEEALYEAFDGDGDAFGVLILVYDIVQAYTHLDFVLNLLVPSCIYSKSINAGLLNFAIKNKKTEIVDAIYENWNNIDCREACFILLESYEDGEKKRQRLQPLMYKAEFLSDDYKQVESYLNSTSDGLETKILVYTNAASRQIAPSMNCVVKHIIFDKAITQAQIQEVYQAFCMTKPKDSELYQLITDIYTDHAGGIACMEMQELLNHDIFIRISEQTVRKMLKRSDILQKERLELFELAQHCKLNAKDNDSILGEILLHVEGSFEDRIELVRNMMKHVETISKNTLTDYIVKSTLDGEKKQCMLEELFRLELNTSFFRDVLNDYIRESQDNDETKQSVIQFLGEQGIGMDSNMLLEIACHANASDYMQKAALIQKSISNGTRIGGDSLSRYLEEVKPSDYHGEFISLLNTPASLISDLALANYVLYSKDSMEMKLKNAMVFAERNGNVFGESECKVRHLNSVVTCNLFQAVILNAGESAEEPDSIVDAMRLAKARLNADIFVDGQMYKFKKYISNNKTKLSSKTLELCTQNKVFSYFF